MLERRVFVKGENFEDDVGEEGEELFFFGSKLGLFFDEELEFYFKVQMRIRLDYFLK